MDKLCKEVDRKLTRSKETGIIFEENRLYLKRKENKIGRFYLLPKIHKRLVDVPERLVVSNCGTPTEKISEFVDFHLQPIVKTLPHVIKDITEFLCKLKELGDIPEGAIICSMDVVGLYPHIPHDEGLESIREAMQEYNSNLDLEKRVPVEELVDLAKLIFENNYFEFEDKIYHQKLGTAIGTKFASSFANIFVSKSEEKILKGYHLDPLV